MKARVFLLAAACAACASVGPQRLDGGRIERSVYRNDYFGFSLPVPESATVESSAQNAKMFEEGLASTAPVSAGLPLLALRLRESLPNALDGAVIACAVEKLPPGAAIKDGFEYLDGTRAMMDAQRIRFKIKTPAHPVSIGGEGFTAERYEVQSGGTVLQSELAVSLRRGYAFVVSVTFESEEGFSRARDVLRSAAFRPPGFSRP